MMRTLFALAAVIFVSACASLTADRPLFTSADQVGPAPLVEGIWIVVSDECPMRFTSRHSGRFPRNCVPMEIRRGGDGVWILQVRFDLMSAPPEDEEGDLPTGPVRLTIVAALEHPDAESFAPLYVAEYASSTEDAQVSYIGIAPIGTMPAHQFMGVDLSCIAILRDGPIPGIDVAYRPREDTARASDPPQIQSCRATTQSAVREATRRALIESFSSLADDDQRFVFVREH